MGRVEPAHPSPAPPPPPPAPVPGRPRRRWWVVAVIAAAALVAAASWVTIPYYAEGPGPAREVTPLRPSPRYFEGKNRIAAAAFVPYL